MYCPNNMSSVKRSNMYWSTIMSLLKRSNMYWPINMSSLKSSNICIGQPICHPESAAICIDYTNMPPSSIWFTKHIEIHIVLSKVCFFASFLFLLLPSISIDVDATSGVFSLSFKRVYFLWPRAGSLRQAYVRIQSIKFKFNQYNIGLVRKLWNPTKPLYLKAIDR